ncbi:MFS general substrate transporter [Heliocybe sulcata]|uniref:MFS general substrate transporter n=1 Tax=Heliocybe sulcata TaxID=5364 RepID=A0A5C3MY22_9AGAM|nr:MFS general substrate transporter [Heliocybe sulcata]
MEQPAASQNVLALQSGPRKKLLLAVFCFAQFLDTFNNSALFAAIPPISAAIGISNSNSVWLLSAYQLTFAALLLVSGRLSDLYDPKIVFIAGAAPMSFFALGAGFVRSQVPLIVLRAFMGVGAALTIPSALHLIVHMYPDPAEQAPAMGLFAGSGAIGNVIGLIIGALLVTYTSWPWVFYFVTIVAFCVTLSVFILVPWREQTPESAVQKARRFKRIDIFGVSLLTVALILLVFAVTSGSTIGWRTGRAIAPLILSVLLAAAFFVWEARIEEEFAALPPKMWFYENFSIIVASALIPFMWWGVVQMLFSWYWQEVYGWSTIMTAVRFLPVGLMSFPVVIATNILQKLLPLKYVTLIGQALCLTGTALLAFGNSPHRYWSYVFPGLVIGTSGSMVIFTTVNIAVFAVTPPAVAGMAGAIFNCALQISCAVGTAIITSIQTSVQSNHGGPTSFYGRSAGFWFLFAFVALITVCVLVFMHNTLPPQRAKPDAKMEERASQGDAMELMKPADQDSVVISESGRVVMA